MTIRQSDKGGDRITPKAVELFRQMLDYAGCTCPKGKEGSCPACQRWWRLHSELHDALGLMPGQWPAVADPDWGKSDDPPETAAFEWWPKAQALYRELERRAAA